MVIINKDKVALITGGGTGVGRSVCLGLARMGYSIVVNYSRSEKEANSTVNEIREMGIRAEAICANIAIEFEVIELVRKVLELFGRIDILICNAGTTHFIEYTDLNSLTNLVWNDIFQTNIIGSFYCFRECIEELKRNHGSVVFVTSVSGITGMGSSIPYALSKGALNTLTKSLAKTYGPHVRINAVAPGPIKTRWLEGHLERITEYLKHCPLGEACSAEDVSEAIIYLAIQTKMTTGQILVVDGGRTT